MQCSAQAGGESMQFTGNDNPLGSSIHMSYKSSVYYAYRIVLYLHYNLTHQADLTEYLQMHTVEMSFLPPIRTELKKVIAVTNR